MFINMVTFVRGSVFITLYIYNSNNKNSIFVILGF